MNKFIILINITQKEFYIKLFFDNSIKRFDFDKFIIQK